MSLPEWTNLGVLPPVHPTEVGSGSNRSPYSTTFQELVDRFSTSAERIDILKGFLRYRTALYEVGIVRGFQWLGGSFVENIESLEERSPRDMDVITFFYIPEDTDQRSLAARSPDLFASRNTKHAYQVDAYSITLGEPMTERHVKMIAYWYSMWSHRRDGTWKGFVQVDLDPEQDAAVRQSIVTHVNRDPS